MRDQKIKEVTIIIKGRDTALQCKIRDALDRYNERIAEHLAFQLGYTEDEIIELIDEMPDNRE